MISKSKIKLIKSLSSKKFREKHRLFLVEGDKNVSEVLNSKYSVKELYATENFIKKHENAVHCAETIIKTEPGELKKASLLVQPRNALAICVLPASETLMPELRGLSLFLDGIQDPGNLGTIIRICDWFGLEQLFCSPCTADVFNPKVIQSSMGSFCRVDVVYRPFEIIAEMARSLHIPIYGTFTRGRNIYGENLPAKALVVLGNEGGGISSEVAAKTDYKIKIPLFKKGTTGPESLNVAVVAGIICSEFRRNFA
jgi:RNA methyltransferase, TrmH family